MGIMGIFTRADDAESVLDEVTASDLLAGPASPLPVMTKSMAMAIPAFAACVDTIAGTVATLPVRLYERKGDSVVEIEDDPRVRMLNGDTGDTLTGPEMKYAMVEDYYCSNKGGNMFVNRPSGSNEVLSLHYVRAEDIQPMEDRVYDPIFKHVSYLVGGRRYDSWRFVRILRATRNGRFGRSIIEENNEALAVAYTTMTYEGSLVQRGGNKRGFLTSAKTLGKEALLNLKEAWRRFYGSNSENVIVLNSGLDFKEATATSVEMQLNENKRTNSDDIYAMFKMPPEIIRSGGTDNASKNARDNYSRFCIMSVLSVFNAALDRDLLLESEKSNRFFAFDLSELTKADMKERWEAWKVAKDGGFVMPDEVRKKENLPPLGMDYISLGLNDVLFDAESGKIVVPNMGKVFNIDALPEGGEGVQEPKPAEGGEQYEGQHQE